MDSIKRHKGFLQHMSLRGALATKQSSLLWQPSNSWIASLTLAMTLILMFFTALPSNAKSIKKVIAESGINKSAVAISIKDVHTGKTVFAYNQNHTMLPASTLKLITYSAALDKLGKDYEFITTLYKTTNNDLILKLGADPYLTSFLLDSMIETAKAKGILAPKTFYIDDSILDATEWGEGWQWDDSLNPLMPKFSAYNLDSNLLTVLIDPTTSDSPANIRTTKFYPVTFMNLVTTGSMNKVEFSRTNHISPDIITVQGTVASQISTQIPVNNPQRYFKLRLEDAIRKQKIDYYAGFKNIKTPQDNIYTVKEIKHSISMAQDDILQNSSNLAAETVFKLSGGVQNVNEYCQRQDLDMDDIRIVDGSGVSKNNIMTADFMSGFLLKEAPWLEDLLPTPGQGTLKNRMLYFKGNLRAKTGTLSDVSAIAGYITTMKGKTYAFDIMINDPKSKSNDKKLLEEYILRTVHKNY